MARTYSTSRFVAYANVALAPLAALAIVGFVIYAAAAGAGRVDPPVTIQGALMASVLVLAIFAPLTYVSLRSITQIRVHDDGVVELRGPLLRRLLRPSDITAVRAHPLVRNSVQVRHTGGRVPVCMPMDGFYEFLAWLKQKNPSVEIRWL